MWDADKVIAAAFSLVEMLSLVSFVPDTFLTRPESIQPANGPTIFTFLSHSAARLPHAVSRLSDDDVTARRPKVAARLPDAADCLTPSLSAFLPHGPARLHPLAFLPCLHGGKVDLSEQVYGEVFLGY